MKTFGEVFEQKKEKLNLILRKVSSMTEKHQLVINKFKKGEPFREQVLEFAKIYNLPKKELIISWQCDKLANKLLEENDAEEILKVTKLKVKPLKTIIK